MTGTIRALLCGLMLAVAPAAYADEGYRAGYKWAEANSIDDPNSCYNRYGNVINNSPSFTAGCLEYLRDQGITNDEDEVRSDKDDDNENGDED